MGFWGGDGEEGMGEHGQGDVPVPGMPFADPVVVQAALVLGGLEAFLDRPPGAGDCVTTCSRLIAAG